MITGKVCKNLHLRKHKNAYMQKYAAMSVGNRIKEAAKSLGGQRALAEQLQVSERAIAGYVSGASSPQLQLLERIAEATGESLIWLATGQSSVGMPDAAMSNASAGLVSIPRYEIQASAGDGLSVLSEEVADYFTVSRDWIMRYCPPGAKLGLIEAKGDSMDPTIRDGDGLIIRLDVTRADVGAGGIFVLNYNGNLLVKRIQVQLDGSVIVASDNINYRTETLTPDAAEQLLDVRAQVLLNIAPPRSALIPR